MTISEIHLDLGQDYIFIWVSTDYCPQRGVLKLDYPLVGDAFDPVDAVCQSHTPLHLRVFFPHFFRAKDGMVEMTPKPLILRLPWLVMHIHVWIENKVTVIVKKRLPTFTEPFFF